VTRQTEGLAPLEGGTTVWEQADAADSVSSGLGPDTEGYDAGGYDTDEEEAGAESGHGQEADAYDLDEPEEFDGAEVTDAGEPAEDSQARDYETPEVVRDKQAREAARLVRVLQDRQAEVARLKDENARLRGDATEEESGEGEELEAEVDEDENALVDQDGEWLPESAAARLAEMESQLHAVTAELEADRFQQEVQEEQQLLGELQEAAGSLLTAARQQALPDLPEERGRAVDQYLGYLANAAFAQSDWSGLEETQILEQIDAVAQWAVRQAQDLFSVYAVQQLADNAKYGQDYRVRPDAAPGVPAPPGGDMLSYLNLPAPQQREIAQKAARMATARKAAG
jgi:hypothetical protein